MGKALWFRGLWLSLQHALCSIRWVQVARQLDMSHGRAYQRMWCINTVLRVSALLFAQTTVCILATPL